MTVYVKKIQKFSDPLVDRQIDELVRHTNSTLDALNAHEALTEAHGATGAVVGTTNVQTLTNKTLTDPVISKIVAPADLEIDCGPEKTAVLTEPVTDDVYPSAIAVGTAGANVPAFTAYSGGLKAYEFLGAALLKEINAQFQIYHSYKQGTDAALHCHLFIPDNAAGGVIQLGAEVEWDNVGANGAGSSSTIYTTITRTAAQGVSRNAIAAFTALAGAGKLISSIVGVRIFRDPTDAADTFAASVWLRSSDIHIQKDTQGSRTPFVK